ncbi:MAG TPA: hypothetical protein VLF09_10480 [Cellvibrio sp.]|nr:hypothetical protein [Cellvibrio sp.]
MVTTVTDGAVSAANSGRQEKIKMEAKNSFMVAGSKLVYDLLSPSFGYLVGINAQLYISFSSLILNEIDIFLVAIPSTPSSTKIYIYKSLHMESF